MLVAIAVTSACGTPPAPETPVVQSDAGQSMHDASIAASADPVDAGAIAMTDAGIADAAAAMVAVDIADAREIEATLTPDAPTVAPNAQVTFTLRVVNKSDHALKLRFQVPEWRDLEVVDAKGVTIAPPKGEAKLLENPTCARAHCGSMPSLAWPVAFGDVPPGGELKRSIAWSAQRVAWPPPQKRACCEMMLVDPIPTGPLEKGVYRVTANIALERGYARVAASASASVDVR